MTSWSLPQFFCTRWSPQSLLPCTANFGFDTFPVVPLRLLLPELATEDMTNRLFSFLSTCFVGGLLVVLPLWLTIMLICAAISALRDALHPVGGGIVAGSAYPHLLSALILGAALLSGGRVHADASGTLNRPGGAWPDSPCYAWISSRPERAAPLDRSAARSNVGQLPWWKLKKR